MTVALRGNLRDFGIGEVFQLIGQQRKTGELQIEASHGRMRVLFSDGSVVSADTEGPDEHAALSDMLVRTGLLTPHRLVELERVRAGTQEKFHRLLIQEESLSAQQIEEIEDLVTQETIFGLLRCTSGSFHFSPKHIQHSRDPSQLLPAEQILMDGLRMVDEWHALDPAAVTEDTVFQRVGRFEAYREWARDDSPKQLRVAERVFLSVDGRVNGRRIIDLSRLGTFEGARILTALRRSGVIEPLDPASLPRSRRRRISARGTLPAPAALAAALLPFVLLAALVGLVHRAPAAAPPGSSVPRLDEPLETARSHFATRRLRHLAEAHRYATGAWPGDLEALVELGWLEARTLAPGELGSYYYRRGEDGPVILGPEF